ncbi:hypothetical protein N1851_024092 [Merluccius polli]|uniref:Transposase domain-containing protein n=1 Tax=Merluccius polli TaxID=89951 RepID=A0AA47NUP7_MERPO|nr:hypothetical protein N1851_024092 [Merluccius polli]
MNFLVFLRDEDLPLPKDSRTLLGTPRNIPTEEKCGGQYIYLGITSSVVNILKQNTAFLDNSNSVDLVVSIDGINIFKASPTQLWPIICTFSVFEPFVVAMYYGTSKPDSVNDYLADFLAEYTQLQENKIVVNGKEINVQIKAFVCDAPARAFVKCIKGHTGYYSCERCIVKGEYKNKRVVYLGDYPLRTDVAFANGLYNDHQLGVSPLLNVWINCVTGFPLDYMHLVCLGVVKRLLCFFKKGPPECRLSQGHLHEISTHLVSLSGKLPSEFAPQPRSLTELNWWKATEFRQFVLYTGPVVLKKVLHKDVYDHFLCLTVALSILLDSCERRRVAYMDFAEQLLSYFVAKCEAYIHSSFPGDCRNYQCSLNDICAFPFENHLQVLKRLVRNAKNPICQVTKRLIEQERAGSRPKETGKKSWHFVAENERNGCFLLHNEDFAFVKEKRDGRLLCDIISQNSLESFILCLATPSSLMWGLSETWTEYANTAGFLTCLILNVKWLVCHTVQDMCLCLYFIDLSGKYKKKITSRRNFDCFFYAKGHFNWGPPLKHLEKQLGQYIICFDGAIVRI